MTEMTEDEEGGHTLTHIPNTAFSAIVLRIANGEGLVNNAYAQPTWKGTTVGPLPGRYGRPDATACIVDRYTRVAVGQHLNGRYILYTHYMQTSSKTTLSTLMSRLTD